MFGIRRSPQGPVVPVSVDAPLHFVEDTRRRTVLREHVPVAAPSCRAAGAAAPAGCADVDDEIRGTCARVRAEPADAIQDAAPHARKHARGPAALQRTRRAEDLVCCRIARETQWVHGMNPYSYQLEPQQTEREREREKDRVSSVAKWNRRNLTFPTPENTALEKHDAACVLRNCFSRMSDSAIIQVYIHWAKLGHCPA